MIEQIKFEEDKTEILLDEINPETLAGFGLYLSLRYPYDIKPISVHYSLVDSWSKITCKSTTQSIYDIGRMNDLLTKYINLITLK